MIVIICAMKEEAKEIISLMNNVTYKKLNYFEIALGKINNLECVVAICGIGKVHAASCTQSLITKFHPKFILNIGVSGAIDTRLSIGDIVIASSTIQHDFDISVFPNRKKGEISGIDSVKINCCPWIINKLAIQAQKLTEVKFYIGTVLTGDQFISSKTKLLALKKEFGGIACDMEAGSIAQTCFLNKIDLGIIRAISDNANDNSPDDFYSFIKSSSKNCASLAYELIKSI